MATDGKLASNNGKVLMSFHPSSKDICTKIADELKKRGFEVLLSSNADGGESVDAMSELMEAASVVLICFSHHYKESPNCAKEAKYALSLRKSIVPLKVEAGYTSDGWLGFIVGSKLFFDFAGKYPFDKKMDDLQQELRRHLK